MGGVFCLYLRHVCDSDFGPLAQCDTVKLVGTGNNEGVDSESGGNVRRLAIVQFLIVMIFSLIVGCAPVPEPSGYGHTTQHTMQSVQHWQVLADDVADQIKRHVDNPEEEEAKYFYVNRGESKTSFARGFHDLLVSSMVKQGLLVTEQEFEGVTKVGYDVQVVSHKANRGRGRARTGLGKMLRDGIVVFRDVVTLGAVSSEKVPHTEVLITVSIVDKNTFLLHRTDSYYINDPDFAHYGEKGFERKKMAVVGE